MRFNLSNLLSVKLKMSSTNIYLCLYFLFLHIFMHSSDAYIQVRLQDFACANNLLVKQFLPKSGKPTIFLSEEHESAAFIKQVWDSSMFVDNKMEYDCNFRVLASESAPKGIFTVITKLKFRQDSDLEKNNTCLDYIQFSSGNRPPSERICNEIPKSTQEHLVFDQRIREVLVHIHIDKDHPIHEPLELNMVLTSYTKCNKKTDFLCDPKDSYSCISGHFVGDNITNCMHPCKDETSCLSYVNSTTEVNKKVISGDTTNLTSNGTFNQTQKLSINGLESEKGEICNLKIDFLKEKMNKEFELEEKKIKLKHDKLELEEKKLDFEKEKFKEEKEIKKLQIEKEERIAKFDIEMKYKSKSFNQQ